MIVVVLAIIAASFALTPTPGALLVRVLFERGARDQTAKLEVGAPVTDLVADVPYRAGDPDAYLDVYTPTGTTTALPTRSTHRATCSAHGTPMPLRPMPTRTRISRSVRSTSPTSQASPTPSARAFT